MHSTTFSSRNAAVPSARISSVSAVALGFRQVPTPTKIPRYNASNDRSVRSYTFFCRFQPIAPY